MFSIIMLTVGIILMMVSVKEFIKQINLLSKGVRTKAKIVELQSFSYITYGSENNKFYNFGINPILELDTENSKLMVDYHNYDDMTDLSEGDELEVIYPIGELDKITRYSSKFKLLKRPVEEGVMAIILIIVSIVISIL